MRRLVDVTQLLRLRERHSRDQRPPRRRPRRCISTPTQSEDTELTSATDGGCFSKVLGSGRGGSLVGGPLVATTWWAVLLPRWGVFFGFRGRELVPVDLGEVVAHHQ